MERSGALARGSSDAISAQLLNGTVSQYEVVFDKDVTQCAYIATVGGSGTAPPPPGEIGVASMEGDQEAVLVETYNELGEEAAGPFHLAVFC